MKLLNFLALAAALASIGCGRSSETAVIPAAEQPVAVLPPENCIFHLDAESTRLVVTRGDEVVQWGALSVLCQQLNQGKRPADAVVIQGVMLTRQGIDGVDPAVEGSVATAAVYLRVDGEWRAVIAERFDAGFSKCVVFDRGLVDSVVP